MELGVWLKQNNACKIFKKNDRFYVLFSCFKNLKEPNDIVRTGVMWHWAMSLKSFVSVMQTILKAIIASVSESA